MMALRAMMAAGHSGSSNNLIFHFTDNTYTPPSSAILFDYDPYGRPSFNFKTAGYSAPTGSAVNFNFTS